MPHVLPQGFPACSGDRAAECWGHTPTHTWKGKGTGDSEMVTALWVMPVSLEENSQEVSVTDTITDTAQ